MPRLIVMRHAQAVPELNQDKDFERALTQKGIVDAERAGAFMAVHDIAPHLALVSPAKRTDMTCNAVLTGLKQAPAVEKRQDIYNAPVDTLATLVRGIADHIGTALLIGHNPGIHALAMFMADAPERILAFSPATLCDFEWNGRWSDLSHRCGSLQNMFIAE